MPLVVRNVINARLARSILAIGIAVASHMPLDMIHSQGGRRWALMAISIGS
jgi:hypothetical protein